MYKVYKKQKMRSRNNAIIIVRIMQKWYTILEAKRENGVDIMSISLERGAGILMPISSLSSPYGIGTLGEDAYRFADWLKEAGQKYWQVLPVGPTSYGDSPYQSYSAFAGNPYFIDLDTLVKEGCLAKEDMDLVWYEKEDSVDYSKLFENRACVLRKAFHNSRHREDYHYHNFCNENAFWLEDYSLFMAAKAYFSYKPWSEWDDDIKFRNYDAIQRYKGMLSEDIDFWKFCQFKFFEQWSKFKNYVNELGIKIIGDIPLYVSLDSVDVWANERLFEMDDRKRPTLVAGVPPDCFSEDGQLWGNPIYRWSQMEAENFDWWRKRMSSVCKLYDVIRIDHFIGIVRYYAIPFGSENAKTGEWRMGPGERLTRIIDEIAYNAAIIAEDLGVLVPPVRELMQKMNWPGMKILEFAFDSGVTNEYLPHNYKSDCTVLYAGTHDNDTIVGFVNSAPDYVCKYVKEYLDTENEKDIPREMIKACYQSIARTVIIQMQDVLELDTHARINMPATTGSNWCWRMKPGSLKTEDALWLKKKAEIYGR